MSGIIYGGKPPLSTDNFPAPIKAVLDTLFPPNEVPMPVGMVGTGGKGLMEAIRPLLGSLKAGQRAVKPAVAALDLKPPTAAEEAFSGFLNQQQLEPLALDKILAASKVTGKVPPQEPIHVLTKNHKVPHTVFAKRSGVEIPPEMPPSPRPPSVAARREAEQKFAAPPKPERSPIRNNADKGRRPNSFQNFLKGLAPETVKGIQKEAAKGISRPKLAEKYGIKNHDWLNRIIDSVGKVK
jgi:hypothetical protein